MIEKYPRASTFKVLSNEEWEKFQKVINEQCPTEKPWYRKILEVVFK